MGITTDAMARMKEHAGDCRRREWKYLNEERMEDDEWPSARLLDLKKMYPRMIKPALWMPLERYTLRENSIWIKENLY